VRRGLLPCVKSLSKLKRKEFVAQNLKQELITYTNGKIPAIEAYPNSKYRKKDSFSKEIGSHRIIYLIMIWILIQRIMQIEGSPAYKFKKFK
jgi:hypothetical protein